MRENAVRRMWERGEAAVNGWLGIPSPIATENMGQAGWDSLTVDMQHGLVGYSDAVPMLQAITAVGATPLVRVPALEPGIIQKSLDAGAYGVICPMINNREEAEAMVASCRYPPEGARSFGPTRALWYAGADYPQKANETIIVLPMIETRAGVENMEEIIATPGVDGVYVGPADLGLAFGYPPKPDRDEPELLKILDRIVETCLRHGKAPCIHCFEPAYAREAIAKGFKLVTVKADNVLLNLAAKAAVAETRGAGAAPAPAPRSAY